MTEKSLNELLAQLNRVLEETDEIDDETRRLVEDLDEDINRLLDTDSSAEDFESVTDRARAVQSHFAVEHPVADRFLREIIDALAKVGI
jgi:uncharacterized protein YoxC